MQPLTVAVCTEVRMSSQVTELVKPPWKYLSTKRWMGEWMECEGEIEQKVVVSFCDLSVLLLQLQLCLSYSFAQKGEQLVQWG